MINEHKLKVGATKRWLGRKLQLQREWHRITQVALAEYCGVQHTKVALAEKGLGRFDILIILMDALGMELSIKTTSPSPFTKAQKANPKMAATADFKPSQVVLGTPPLGATMRRTEVECAAGILVWAMAQGNNEWRALRAKELGELVGKAISDKTEPIASWNRNPFMRPDFAQLVEFGFAEKTGEPGAELLTFTQAGLDAIKKWVPS